MADSKRVVAEALRFGVGKVTPDEVWKALERRGMVTRQVGEDVLCTSLDTLAEEVLLVNFVRSGRDRHAPLLAGEIKFGDGKLSAEQRAANFMSAKAFIERVAFSLGEFAELFGNSQTWGYRQIYSGKVKAITDHGRVLIPAAETDAVLQKAGIYDGIKLKVVKTKSEIQALAPQLSNAWRTFLVARRQLNRRTRTTKFSSLAKR